MYYELAMQNGYTETTTTFSDIHDARTAMYCAAELLIHHNYHIDSCDNEHFTLVSNQARGSHETRYRIYRYED